MIELHNVSFAYNGKAILQDLSLTVSKGDFTVLVGATGSGKTTLLQLLIGELIPDSGTIAVGNTRIDSLSRSRVAHYRRSVGFVFDEIALLEERNVEENVALPLEIDGKLKKNAIRERVHMHLEAVNLSDKARSFPRELSYGEAQRASIARALITEPLVLVADCPTAQLDRASSREIISILANENIRGMTVLLAITELQNRELLPRNAVFYRLYDGDVHRFLPETGE